MRKFIIEREVPGIGGSTSEQLRSGAQTSNEALADVGPGIQWQHSYVTADGTYCLYLAESEELIREHAKRSGFPANRITEVHTMFDPTTGHC